MNEQAKGLRIRPGMDVYSAYQNQYIGSVVKVWRGGGNTGSTPDRGASAQETGSAPEAAQSNPELVHEEGSSVDPTARTGSQKLGEEMGPVPTIALGNSGPVSQSAAHAYATGETGGPEEVVCFAVRPGRMNLGPLTSPLYVPTTAVHSVSMERVVLDIQKEEIPKEWRRKPAL